MSKDYRSLFINSVQEDLVYKINHDNLSTVMDSVIKILNDYEITERCTEIAVQDSVNDRLLKRYVACLRVDGKSENTIYNYYRSAIKLSEFVKKPFPEMGAYDIRFFLACEKDRGISERSVENTRSNLSAFFNWLTIEEVIIKNPMGIIKPIKFVDEIKKAFSDIEIDSMRSQCNTLKERALFEFLLSSGVRVAELSSIEINDISFSELSVHVRNGKGGKERMTYITPICASHLQKYLYSRKDSCQFLFCNRYNGQLLPGGIRFLLNKLAKRSNVDNVHPHRFRRTFATSAAKRGLEVQEIQKLLGHANINTTMKYICMDDETVKLSYKRYIV